LADFCGSLLDGSTSLAASSARSVFKTAPIGGSIVKPDKVLALFYTRAALDIDYLLIEMTVRFMSFFQKREFPCLTGLARSLSSVIEKCWRDQYNSTEEVKFDLGKTSPSAPLEKGAGETYVDLAIDSL
jgi:hypothetical protein